MRGPWRRRIGLEIAVVTLGLPGAVTAQDRGLPIPAMPNLETPSAAPRPDPLPPAGSEPPPRIAATVDRRDDQGLPETSRPMPVPPAPTLPIPSALPELAAPTVAPPRPRPHPAPGTPGSAVVLVDPDVYFALPPVRTLANRPAPAPRGDVEDDFGSVAPLYAHPAAPVAYGTGPAPESPPWVPSLSPYIGSRFVALGRRMGRAGGANPSPVAEPPVFAPTSYPSPMPPDPAIAAQPTPAPRWAGLGLGRLFGGAQVRR